MKIVCAVGTRPEKIKMAPVVEALRARGVKVVEWVSGQSKDLVNNFDDTTIRRSGAWGYGLAEGIAGTMQAFNAQLVVDRPDAVIVQGDTATAFACAQAAFLARVSVAHVEAGLRTYASEPWPEEAFRRQIGALTDWDFAPDEDAAANLLREAGWRDEELLEAEDFAEACKHSRVYVVGNTVIDTLPRTPFRVLATLHRRENWGRRIEEALDQLDLLAREGAFVRVVKHPNWSAWLDGKDPERHWRHIDFQPPFSREDLLEELQAASVVVTDSGGLQEECAHYGVPCLVLRTCTERVALERSGAIKLISPDSPDALRAALEAELSKRRAYGRGDSGEVIAGILVRELTRVDTPTNVERDYR